MAHFADFDNKATALAADSIGALRRMAADSIAEHDFAAHDKLAVQLSPLDRDFLPHQLASLQNQIPDGRKDMDCLEGMSKATKRQRAAMYW